MHQLPMCQQALTHNEDSAPPPPKVPAVTHTQPPVRRQPQPKPQQTSQNHIHPRHRLAQCDSHHSHITACQEPAQHQNPANKPNPAHDHPADPPKCQPPLTHNRPQAGEAPRQEPEKPANKPNPNRTSPSPKSAILEVAEHALFPHVEHATRRKARGMRHA